MIIIIVSIGVLRLLIKRYMVLLVSFLFKIDNSKVPHASSKLPRPWGSFEHFCSNKNRGVPHLL